MSDNTTSTSDRLKTPDVIKGFIMIVIVMVHFILFSGSSDGRSSDPSLVIQGLYLGLMLFFIISGYFFRPGRGFYENIKKRVLQLLIPIFLLVTILPLIVCGWMMILGQPVPFDQWEYMYYQYVGGVNILMPVDQVSSLIEPGYNTVVGYYFLEIMIVGFLIFYAVADHVMDDVKKMAATIVVLLTVTALLIQFVPRLPFMAHMGPLAASFMLMGAYAGKIDLIRPMEHGGWKSKEEWIKFVIAAVAFVVLIVVFPPGTGFDISRLGGYGMLSTYIYFIEALFAGYVITCFMSWVSKVPYFSDLLIEIGQHSLAIILFHAFVYKMIIAPFYPLVSGMTFPDVSTTTIIIFALITLVIVVVGAEMFPKVIAKIRGEKA